MAAIKWCMAQKRGIKLTEPNDNLFHEYIQTAEESLDILKSIKGSSKVWSATTKYYCEYFAAYSLLMKIGIKCEIHDCTIAVCSLLEAMAVIPKGYTEILEEDKQLRIDNQYYLKNRDVPIDYDKIVEFVIAIKNIAVKLTKDKIEHIREKIINV
ncbi:hypothetical protein KY347_01750 [Candidatus Woesearchaeota archaeon]|nr:hypothetical protein [Candidatus Woesearchaeota archaeon]